MGWVRCNCRAILLLVILTACATIEAQRQAGSKPGNISNQGTFGKPGEQKAGNTNKDNPGNRANGQKKPEGGTRANGQNKPEGGTRANGQNNPEGGPRANGQNNPEGGPRANGQNKPADRKGQNNPEGGPSADGQKKPEGGPRSDGQKKPEGGPRSDGQKKPEGGQKKPEGGQKKPEGGQKKPEGGQKKPEGGQKKPEGGQKKPEGGPRGDGQKKPEGGPGGDGQKKPEGGPRADGQKKPEGGPRADGQKKPEGGQKKPEGGQKKPEGGQKKPEGGQKKPEGGPRGDGQKKPEGGPGGDGQKKPEGGPRADGQKKPEGGPRADGQKKPEGGQKKPEGGQKKPEGGQKKPEGGPRADGQKKPEGGPRADGQKKPEGGQKKPEGGQKKPEGGQKKPEGGPRGDGQKKPEGGQKKPEGGPRGDGQKKPEGVPRGDGQKKPEGGPRAGGQIKPEGGPRDGKGQNKPEGGPRAGGQNKPEGGPRAGGQNKPEGGSHGKRKPEGGTRPRIQPNQKGSKAANENNPKRPGNALNRPNGRRGNRNYTRITEANEFRKVEHIKRHASCNNSRGFGGPRLDNKTRQESFQNGLGEDLKMLYRQINESEEMNVDDFTKFELMKVMKYMAMKMNETQLKQSLTPLKTMNSETEMSPDELKELVLRWIPAYRLLLKPKVMCDLNKVIPYNLLGDYCGQLAEFYTTPKQMSDIEERCAHCTAYFASANSDEELTTIFRGPKANILYRLMRDAFEYWDLIYLRFGPGEVTVDDIKRINDTAFLDDDQLEILKSPKLWHGLKPHVKAELGRRMLDIFGPLSQWSKTKFDNLVQYPMCLSPEKLKDMITLEMFKDFDMDFLKDYPKAAHRFFGIGALKLREHFKDKKALFDALPNKEDLICLMMKYKPTEMVFGEKKLISFAKARQAISNCKRYKLNYKELFFIFEDLFENNFDWTAASLLRLDEFVPYVSLHRLLKTQPDDLYEYWTQKKATFDQHKAKMIFSKIKSKFEFRKFGCNEMEMLQEGILALMPHFDLKRLPKPIFSECAHVYLPYLNEGCAKVQRLCSSIWPLIKESSSLTNTSLVGLMKNMTDYYMEHYIPEKDMKQIKKEYYGKKGNESDTDTIITPTGTPRTKKMGNDERGDMKDGSPNEKRRLQKKPRIVGRESRLKEIDDLPEDDSLFEVASDITPEDRKDNRKKSSLVFGKMRKMLGIGKEKSKKVCIKEDNVEKVAGIFTEASEEDLRGLDRKSRKGILKRIGDNKEHVKYMTRPKSRYFLKVQLNTTGLEDGDEITPEIIQETGPELFCGMTKEMVARLSQEALTENIALFARCNQLDQETRKELAETYIELKGGLKEMLKFPPQIEEMGTFLLYAPNLELDLDEEEKQTLKVLLEKVQSKVEKRRERLRGRHDRDISHKEQHEEKKRMSHVNRKRMRLNSRKSLDCQEISKYNNDLEFLDHDDIKRINASVLEECIEEFHGTNWEMDELRIIRSKLRKIFGNDTATWSSDVIMKVGPLINSLKPEGIKKMNFSMEAVEYIGNFRVGRKQASAVIEKFMEGTEAVQDISDMTAEMWGSFGKLACGLSVEMIEKMTPSVVLDAASHFADLMCLRSEQLDKLMEKIEKELGSDISKISPEQIEDMGILMAGGSEKLLSSLNEDQLAAVLPKAFGKVEPRKFAKTFPPGRINQLSDDQAINLKSDHMWRMNATQRESMKEMIKKTGFKAPRANRRNKKPATSRAITNGRKLRRDSCEPTLALPGQRDAFLNTPQKIDAFKSELTGDMLTFFEDLLESKNHSVTQFTDIEMKTTLEYIMESVSEDDREDFMNSIHNFEFISDESWEKILEMPPKIHLLQTPEVMCEVTNRLDEDLLETFCERVEGSDVSVRVTKEIIERCADCVILRYVQRHNYEDKPRLDRFKAAIYMRKLRQSRETDWDPLTLAIAPAAVLPGDIDRISNDDHFKNMSQLEVFAHESVSCCLKPEVKRAIAMRLHDALGDLSSWSSDMIDAVGHFIQFYPRSILRDELTPKIVLDNVEDIEPLRMVTQSEENLYTIASWKLIEHFKNSKDGAKKEEDKMKALCLLMKFPTKMAAMDSLYTSEDLLKALPGCAKWRLDSKMVHWALSKISKMSGFSWRAQGLEMLQLFAREIMPHTIKKINKTVLVEKLSDMKAFNFSMDTLRAIWFKVRSEFNVTRFDCDKLKEFGRVVFGFTHEDISKIDGQAYFSCLGHLTHIMGRICHKNEYVCKSVWRKIERFTKKNKDKEIDDALKSAHRSFLRFVPSHILESLPLDVIGGGNDTLNLEDLDLDSTQAETVMRKVKRRKGPMMKKNLNYTGRPLDKLGDVVFKGSSSKDLDELPEGNGLLQGLSKMRRKIKSIDDEKVKKEVGAMYGKVRRMIGMKSKKKVCLDDSTIKQTGFLFKKASRDDLNKLTPQTKKKVLFEIGNDRDVVKTMPRKRIREHYREMKKSRGQDKKGRRKILPKEMDNVGVNLFCGMEENDVDELSDEAVNENLKLFDECTQLDRETRSKIAGRAVESAGGVNELLKKPDLMKALGSMMIDVEMPESSKLSKEQRVFLRSMASDLLKKIQERKRALNEEDDDEIPASEKAGEEMQRNKFTSTLWDALSESPDCLTIQDFEGDLPFIKASDIDALDSNVLVECLEEFQSTDWDKEELQAFARKLKKNFGNDTSRWSKAQIGNAGKFISGLKSEDMDKLTLDTEVIGVIGEKDIGNPKKMFRKYKKDNGIKDVSTIDQEKLSNIGNLVCGISESEMSDLQDKVVKESIDDLAQRDCYSDEQVKILGGKYGNNVSDQELRRKNMEELGSIAGGLPKEKLSKLEDSQLEQFPPSALRKMPAENIRDIFTAERMSKMNKKQLSAIRPKAMRKMTSEQLLTIENVLDGKTDANATAEAMNMTKTFETELPKNVSVQDLDTFKDVRKLQADKCGTFEGQSKSRLDTKDKRDAFESTLSKKETMFFKRILGSTDHNVDQFTGIDMKKMLEHMSEVMEMNDLQKFLELKENIAETKTEELNATFTTWHPNLFLIMKKEPMCSTLGQMDVETLGIFCDRLIEDDVSTATFIEILNRCPDCLAYADAKRTDKGITGALSGFKGKAFYDKLRQWKTSGWDIYHLLFAPDSLETSDVSRVSAIENFKDFGQCYRLGDPEFYMSVPKPVLEAIAMKLSEALGRFSAWPRSRLIKLLPYIANMPPSILESQMKPNIAVSYLSNIEDWMDVASKHFKRKTAWILSRYLIKNAKSLPKKTKKDAFCLVTTYSNNKRLWKDVYSRSEVLEYLPECQGYEISMKTIYMLMKWVVRDEDFAWTEETLEDLDDFLAAVPSSIIRIIDPKLLYNHWKTISNSNFHPDKLRVIWRVLQKEVKLRNLSCEQLKDLGKIFLIFSGKNVESIPDKTVGECIDHVGQLLEHADGKSKWMFRKIWEKLKKYGKANGIGMGKLLQPFGKGSLSQYIPKKDILLVELADLNGVENLANIQISVHHAYTVMRKVKALLGPVTKNNANYSTQSVMEMGSLFYHGATISDLEVLPVDSNFLEMATHMAKYFRTINQKKIEVVFNKLKKFLNFDNSTNICLDRALAEQIAVFFTAARVEDLQKFSADTKRVIFRYIGQKYFYVEKFSRQILQSIFDVLLRLELLTTKKSYDVEDISEYRYMWCGLRATHAKRLTQGAIDSYMGELKSCIHFDPDTRKALMNRVLEISGGANDIIMNNPMMIVDMGRMVLEMDDEEFYKLPAAAKEILAGKIEELMADGTSMQEKVKNRPTTEISEEEKERDNNNLLRIGKIFLRIELEKSSSRKRRSTPAITCEIIQNFNGALGFFESSDIGAIPKNDFEECIPEFQSTNWNDDQLNAFRLKLLETFGSDTRQWSKDDVMAAGALLESLESLEIKNLTVIDDDIIALLGDSVFSKNAPHILVTYMTHQNVSDLSQLEQDTLGNLGNLACGFTPSEMSQMESSAIHAVSSDLSTVECFEKDQLSTLGNKIVEIEGTDWTSAQPDDIASLGVIAAGLPPSVLEDLGDDELSSLDTRAIENMTPETFSAVFTSEKIQSLSSSQANSLTNDQKAQLSPDQLTAIKDVATTASDKNGENGASGLTTSLMTAFLFVIITWIIQ